MTCRPVASARRLDRPARGAHSLFFGSLLKMVFKKCTWFVPIGRGRAVAACVALLAFLCAHAATADEAPETTWRLGSHTPLPVDVRLSTELRRPDIPCDPDETEGDVVVSTRLGRLTLEATLASMRKVQVGEAAETLYVVAARHPLSGDVSGGVELIVNGADGERTLLPGLYVRLSPQARWMLGVEVPLGTAAASAKTVRAQVNWAF